MDRDEDMDYELMQQYEDQLYGGQESDASDRFVQKDSESYHDL
jgi:hypothetical protein